jgi:hypothetical protein
VDKNVSDTWIHKDKKVLSTWVYVVLVMKNGYLTLKQVKRNVASAKISRRLLLSCGNSKTETPT